MRTALRFHRFAIPVIVFIAVLMTMCPSTRAQVPISAQTPALTQEASASLDALNTAPLPSDAAATLPIPHTQSQAPASQEPASVGPAVSRAPGTACDLVSGPLACIGDIFRDQRGIWTAPIRLRVRKLLWLAPFAAATSLALIYDARAMNTLGPSATRVRVSNDFAYLGSTYVVVPAAGLTYLLGKLEHKEGPRETGMLALESLADAGLVVEALKLATNRQRPYVPPGTGKFWPDDTDIYSFSSSFPSGHAAASFAVARLIVEETPGHPWVHVLLYGLATGVAIARVTGENHFPSDALVGSVIGYSVGGYVYHHHSAFYAPKKAKALRIAPLYNPAMASYGVSLSLQP